MFNFSEITLRNKKIIVVIAVVLSATGIAVASEKIQDSPKTPDSIESTSSSPTPIVEATKEALILPIPSPVMQTRPKSSLSSLPSPSPPSQSSPTPTTPTPSVEGTTIAKSEKELRREKLTELAQQPDWCPAKEWFSYNPSDSPDGNFPVSKTCPVEPNPLAVAFNLCYGKNLEYTGNREDVYDICAQEIGL